jgi:FMN reductase
MKILALNCSPAPTRNTRAVLEAMLAGTASVDSEIFEFGAIDPRPIGEALTAIHAADAFIFGTSVDRASLAAPIKELFHHLQRGRFGESDAPLEGRAVAIAATGATFHHFLALNDLRSVLSGNYGAHVVPPGLYVPQDAIHRDRLADAYSDVAWTQGAALVELAAALDASTVLRFLGPQV